MVYWYNVTLKDVASTSATTANEIYIFEVHLKDIDEVSSSEPGGVKYDVYKVWDTSKQLHIRIYNGEVHLNYQHIS